VLVSDATTQTSKRRALAAGATDFLSKPVDPVELPLRVRNLLKTRKLELGLAAQASLLETQVRERTRELATQAAMLEARVQKRSREIDRAQFDALACLAVAAEFRDDTTGQHTLRVGQMAARLARRLDLDGIQVETLRQTAPLHDVGKIGAPDHILLKPAALSAEEWKAMQQHTVIGSRILARHRSPLFKMAAQIALTHHERWDGSGYPRGLAGEAIPLEGRIVALADVFDALTHDRPYKQAWSLSRALAEIEQQAGHQFDPALVTAFLSLDGY
jgi:putative two-component system response regulator